jgi:signal-transduction protein with cAMP-binding, CBS, and nucleotidyltransferase domain
MTLTERMFALRDVAGFDQLRDEELLTVASSMTERRYEPGQVVVSAGSSMWHLLVVVSGRVDAEPGRPIASQVIGADVLLTNRPAARTLTADAGDGAVCLRMSKGHFFTVVSECPALLVEMSRLRVFEQPEALRQDQEPPGSGDAPVTT